MGWSMILVGEGVRLSGDVIYAWKMLYSGRCLPRDLLVGADEENIRCDSCWELCIVVG